MCAAPHEQGLFYPGTEAAREIERRTASPRPAAELPPVRRGLSRRVALRWLGWGVLLALIGQWAVGFAGFFWPKKIGAFGGQVNAGSVSDYQVGQVKVIQDGKFYISRVPEGFVALWWKCPHLGCTVPWKPDDPTEDQIMAKGRFNCPCHGSIYDRYGQIISGPAPRPMDLFPLEVKDGKLFALTDPTKAIQRPKALHGPPDVIPA